MTTCKDEHLGRQLIETAQLLRNQAEKQLKPFNLTLEQLHILKNLSDEGEMSQSALCALANKTPANLTRILDRLEKKDRIIRKNNPKDRRSSLIQLTDSGIALIPEVKAMFEVFSEKMTTGIDTEEQQLVIKVLQQIQLNMQNFQ